MKFDIINVACFLLVLLLASYLLACVGAWAVREPVASVLAASVLLTFCLYILWNHE